ncbi:LamG-like jellyroll fold domain-containing protein [Paenibacillus pectinilyticus]|nr:LamG-like jellyroll fold domain-containing protein [Paenibacillus pectinilyticus]
MRKVVDSNHPLLVLQLKIGPNVSVNDPDFARDNNAHWSIKRAWASIPDDIKPYVVFVLHPGHVSPVTTAQSRKWMEDNLAEGVDENIPMMILYGEQPTSGADGNAWIESLYQNYPNMIGTAVSELTNTVNSVPALLALASTYGGYHIQSNQEQNDVFESKMENTSYYNSVKQNSANFIFAPKTVHNNFQYNSSEALGSWLAGVAGNWGAYWDIFEYFQSVGSPFAEGPPAFFSAPENLWAMNMLDTYMQGATVFCPENDIFPTIHGDLTPVFYNSILPAFRYVIQHPISKSTVMSKIKVAYSASEGTMTSLPDAEGTRVSAFDGLYASQPDPLARNTLYFQPRTTGRYYVVPQIPMLADPSVAAQFPNVLTKSSYTSNFKTRNDKLNYFNNLYPQTYSGDAFAQNVGNQWLVYNSSYAANFNQDAFIPLSAGSNFSEIDLPEMPFGTLAMIDDGANTLSVILNNYKTDHTQDGLYLGGATGAEFQNAFDEYSHNYNPQDAGLKTTTMRVTSLVKPSLTISGFDKHYNYSENWNPATHVYTLTVNHNGAVNIRLDKSDNDASVWTRADDASSSVIYSGTWSHTTGSTYSSSATAGSSVSLDFFGTSIEWIGNFGPNEGTADVYIDNVLWAPDLSTISPTARLGQVIFKKTGLTNASHTIKVVNKSGTIGMDRFSYIPAQIQGLSDITYNDFSYATAAADQGLFSGTDNWTIANGNMKLLPLTGPFNGPITVYYTNASYQDFTYSVDVNSTKGDSAAILFRSDPINTTILNGYSLVLDPLQLNKNNDATNETVKLYKNNTLIGKYALPLSTNTWYTVKIVATGSTIQCYINGSLYITATDSSYTSGKVAVSTVSASQMGGEVLVDNVSVSTGGNVAYSTTFSNWSQASGWKTDGSITLPNWPVKTSFNYPYQWTTSNGTWSVVNDNTILTTGVNGVYSGVANANQTSMAYAGSGTWSDFIYNGQLKFKTGTHYDAGLAFRVQDNNNYFLFSMNGNDNKVYLTKVIGGVSTILASANYAITPNKWYSVGVQAVGQFLTVSVNGQSVLSSQSSAFTQGKVGFSANNGTSALFDDAWIAQPHVDTPSQTPVSSIAVTGAGGATTIITNNAALQMTAAVQPSAAERKDVTWYVYESDGVTPTTKATIDATGVLNALQNGTVKVTAVANDRSYVLGSVAITISGQTSNAGIAGVEPIYVDNEKDHVDLPSQVKVTFTNGSTGNANVVWDAVSTAQSGTAVTPFIDGQTRGKYIVGGTVTGTSLRAYAHVTVVPKITGGIAISASVPYGTKYNYPLYMDRITFDAGGGTTYKKQSNVLWNSYVDTSQMAPGSMTTVYGTIQGYPYQQASVVITIQGTGTNDVSAWYKFDESSGTTASDSSGNGKNATLSGTPSFIAGKSGNAVNLNGSTDYASLPTGIVSNLNDFTIAAWVKPNSVSKWSRVFDFGTGTSKYMFLTVNAGSAPRFAITTSGSSAEQQLNAPSALPTGTWTHLAITWSGNTGTLYVNGVAVATNTNMTFKPSDLGATNQNYFGKSQYNDPYLNGLVDQFKIYNRALSASEVSTLAS